MAYNALRHENADGGREYNRSLPSGAVAGDVSCVENDQLVNANCIQARLLYESLLAETRVIFNSSVSRINFHREATQDSYVRHHLNAIAKEVYEIERAFSARFSMQLDTQDIVAILNAEIAIFDRIVLGRVRRTDENPRRLDIVASWITVQLFRLILHEVIEETVRNTDSSVTIYIRLRRHGKVLRVDINNIELKIRRELLTYFYNRTQIKEKLNALCARIENSETGFSISLPMVAHAIPKQVQLREVGIS
jgi:hypothetical protein